jgi:uncharacterized membrane protein
MPGDDQPEPLRHDQPERLRRDQPEGLRRDQKVERLIGMLLQAGVALAIAVTLFGAILYLGHEGRRVADFRVFRGEPWDLRSVPAVVAAALHGRREAVIQLGVLILIATPVARVLFSLIVFALERDATYVVVTLVVLGVLLSGLLGF